MSKNSIQVAIKVRPLLRREKDAPCCWRVVDNSIQLADSQNEPFYFDHIFDQDASNEMVFEKMAKHIVHSGIRGFNGTIFAYGQTSSGKTYTMMGDEGNEGVMVLAAKEIFKEIERSTDRQFLLRVGYIEIYNEKIYDLLNKKNHDLKIHENATGIVSVNCEENIITCEDDLLYYLCMGNKERTVGETNMNQRSSRSHAIFRIIIESRKTDRSEDDAVIQSVLNLVDLAGSERADQTGARGTRLKEGGHINKSLLFLSNVIKRLSENEDHKYISYRDSKLTRILQASLGGNALTSIICTIKPNAVEETQSTLSFAMRAKTIKNKPEVNEIVSEATMMKRLEREIKDLKVRLAEERHRNESQIKVGQLEQRIKNEVLKIITCNSLHNIRTQKEKRRRTWCAATSNAAEAGLHSFISPVIPQSTSTCGSSISLRQQYAKQSAYCTPYITLRNVPETSTRDEVIGFQPEVPIIEEEIFEPAELCNFENMSPNKQSFPDNICKTPVGSANLRTLSLTPKATGSVESNLKIVERTLLELQEFTNLENKIDVKYDTYDALKQKLDALANRNKYLEEVRLENIEVQNELIDTKRSLANYEKRCDDLIVQVDELTKSNKEATSKLTKYERQLCEFKEKLAQLELENREAVSLEFEFQSQKNKAKLRESELLEAIAEKDREIVKLEKSLNCLSELKYQKVENEKGDACAKCKDLQELLSENEKITHDFAKLTAEYEKLQLNHTQVMMDTAKDRTKIAELEKAQYEEKTECNKLRDEISSMRIMLEKVQQDYTQLHCDMNEKTETCEELNRVIASASKDMRALQEKYDKLEDTWKEQQHVVEEIQDKYDSIHSKYQSLQAEYEKLEKTAAQPLEDCAQLQKENESLQAEICELKTRIEDAQKRLLDKSYEGSTEELRDVKLQNLKLEEDLRQLQQQFDDMQKEYNDLSNQLMDSLQESETLRSQVNSQCKALNAAAVESSEREELWEAAKKVLEDEIADLKQQLRENKSSDKFDTTPALFDCTASSEKETWELAKRNLENEIVILKSELFEMKKLGTPSKQVDCIERFEKEALWEASKRMLENEIDDLKQQLRENKSSENVSNTTPKLFDSTSISEKNAWEAVKVKLENEIADLKLLLSESKVSESINAVPKLVDFTENSEKESPKKSLENEIVDMKLQLYEMNSSSKLFENDSVFTDSMKSSGVCIEKEPETAHNAEFLGKFKELLGTLHIVEIESKSDKSQVFSLKSLNNANGPQCKLLLENIGEVIPKELDRIGKCDERNALLQGLLNQITFSIFEIDTCENVEKTENFESSSINTKYEGQEEEEGENSTVKELKKEINDLTFTNECLSKLLESTERTIGELREQINILSAELLEKSQVLEKCACEDYQKQIDQLEKTLAERTIVCNDYIEGEESHFDSHILTDNTICINKETEKDTIDLNGLSLENSETHEKLLEELQKRCQLLEKNYIEAVEKLADQEKEHAREVSEMQASLASLKEQCMSMEKEHKFEKNQLQLELCEKLELYENKVRENAQKYNIELEESKTEYEKTIATLRDELQLQKIEGSLEITLKKELNLLEEKLETVLKEKETLEDSNIKLKSIAEQLRAEKTKIEKQLVEALQKQENAEQKMFDVSKELENQIEKFKLLARQEAEAIQSIKILKLEHENSVKVLLEEKDKFSIALEDMKQEKFLIEQRKETIELKMETLLQELHEAKLKIQTYDELVNAYADLEKQLSVIMKENANAVQRARDLELAIKEAKENESLNAAKCESQEANIISLQNELRNAQEENAAIKQEQISLQAELESLRDKMKGEKCALDHNLREMKSSMGELQLKVDTLRETNTQLKENNKDLELKLTAMENSKVKIEKEKLDIERSRLDLENSMKGLQQQVDTLQQVNAQNQQDLKSLQSKLEEVESLKMKIEEEHSVLEQKRKSLEISVKELQVQIDILHRVNAQFQQDNKSLEMQLIEVKNLKDTIEEQKSVAEHHHKYLETTIKELQRDLDTLQQVNEQLQFDKQNLELKLKVAADKVLKYETAVGDINTVEALRKEVVAYKNTIKEESERFARLRSTLNTKEVSFEKERKKLETTISSLLLEKRNVEERLHTTEENLKKVESELFLLQKRADSVNNSLESNSSISPRSMKSSDRLMSDTHQQKLKSLNPEERRSAERKNRRLSTHDDRRRQSLWGSTCSKSTMTDPSDTNCNCIELDKKLKECEKNLFIRESQVTALSLEIKHHPAKMENAVLKNRLQEEQDKFRIEIKRYKQMLVEQANKINSVKDANFAKPKQASVETQTESDLETEFRTLQSEHTQLTAVHRHFQVQCDFFQKELQVYKHKYEDAKKVLYSRRKEIERLSSILSSHGHAPT